jgi:hypothetical protein
MVQDISERAEGEALRRSLLDYWKSHAIVAAVKLGIPDLLVDRTRTAAELAEKIEADESALQRFLRALAAIGVTRDLGDGRFAMTHAGASLATDHPSRLAATALHVGSELIPAFPRLDECIRHGRPPAGILYGSDGFAELNKDAEAAEIMNSALVASSRRYGIEVAHAYDFSQFGTIMDVGGGHGGLLVELLKAAPKAEGVVLDLEHAEAGAKMLFAEQGIASRARFISASFFEPLPEHADCYVLKYILHDWPDAEASRIVGHVGDAARDSNGRVILVEQIMPDQVVEDPGHATALYGDLAMMLWNGQERTRSQFRDLLAKGGLSLTRVLPLSDNLFVIEAIPAS